MLGWGPRQKARIPTTLGQRWWRLCVLGREGRPGVLGREGRPGVIGREGRPGDMGREGRPCDMGREGRHSELGLERRPDALVWLVSSCEGGAPRPSGGGLD